MDGLLEERMTMHLKLLQLILLRLSNSPFDKKNYSPNKEEDQAKLLSLILFFIV
jgi:hypothetical protein